MKNLFDRFSHSRKVRRATGWLGVLIVAPLAFWLLIGVLPGIPSMVEVFGVPGLRVPASAAITGLLIAAIGFWDYDQN